MARGWSGQWSARAVPELRAELVDAYGAATARVSAQRATAPTTPQLDAEVAQALAYWDDQAFRGRHADLCWVAADMAAQAMDASQDMPGFAPADLPTRNGLALFGGPLPVIETPPLVLSGGTQNWQGRVPVWGLWWHGVDADTIAVEALTRAGELPAPMVRGCELQPVLRALVPRAEGLIFDEQGPILTTEGQQMGRDSLGLLAFLGAMSVLMVTPTLVERRHLDARSGRAPVEGRTREPDRVTLVDLRPLRQVDMSADEQGEGGREYRHRWIVRGHWRQQPHGPARSLRRLTYVEPFIKGPPDAPLLASERVMVWRR